MFTLNNPIKSPKWEENVQKLIARKDFQYFRYQLEEAPTTKTPHYQCYVEFTESIRPTAISKLFPRASDIDKRRGSQLQAINYVSKEESRIGEQYVYGEPAAQGKRIDLVEYAKLLDKTDTWADVLREPLLFLAVAQYPQWTMDYFYNKKSTRAKLELYHPWQEDLLERISLPADGRTILWYVDEEGGKGKSEITKELINQHDAIILGGRGPTDLYQYGKSQNKVVIWDFPRDSVSSVPYTAIEQITGGYYCSTFRNPQFVKRDYNAHIIIFANFHPIINKLSINRWNIVELTDDDCNDLLKF